MRIRRFRHAGSQGKTIWSWVKLKAARTGFGFEEWQNLHDIKSRLV